MAEPNKDKDITSEKVLVVSEIYISVNDIHKIVENAEEVINFMLKHGLTEIKVKLVKKDIE